MRRADGPTIALIAFLYLAAGVAAEELTDNERLYLAMLIQSHDKIAQGWQEKIGLCEKELARRKHRSAKAGYQEPQRIPLGEAGKWIDLTPDVSRKEIEQTIKFLKQKRDSAQNGTTVPDDRYWSSLIFPKFGHLGRIRVIQVIGPSDMIADREGEGTLWITGISTRNYADDQTVDINEPLITPDGTKSYTNALGAQRTARMLRPFLIDRDKVIAKFRAESQAGAPVASQSKGAAIRKKNEIGLAAKVDATVKPPQTTAAVLTEDEQRYLTAIVALRDARVEKMRRDLEPLQQVARESRKKKGSYRSKSGVTVYFDGLRHMEEDLANLESGKAVVEPEISDEGLSKVGSIMKINTLGLKVVQVNGPADMLARFDRGPHSAQMWWLHGFPTKDLADGQMMAFDELIVIDGTKRYETVSGTSNTVFVWRPLVINREKVLAEYRALSTPTPPTVAQNREKPVPKAKAVDDPDDPEAAARKQFSGVLSNSRKLIDAGMRSAAERNLKRIVAEAPGTAIAKEAQQELDRLKQQP